MFHRIGRLLPACLILLIGLLVVTTAAPDAMLFADGGNSGSGSGGGGNSGSGKSGSGGSHDDDRDDDDRGASNSGPGNQRDDNRLQDQQRIRVEDKARAMFNGFEAELDARFERRADRTRLNVEVEDVNLGEGTMLNVCVAGGHAGQIRLNAFHSGELELDSRDGDSVPELAGSLAVEVRQDACGAATAPILSVMLDARGPVPQPGTQAELRGSGRAIVDGFEAELNARFEQRADRTRFSAEVENLNLPPGTRLNVCVNGAHAGQIVLDALHVGDLNLDSRDGDSVPSTPAGSVVQVRLDDCGSPGPGLIAAVIGAGVPPPNAAAPVRLEGRARRVIDAFEAELNATFEVRADRIRFSAEVENLNLAPGATLFVCVGPMQLGQMVLNALHTADLNLDSRDGHSVPMLTSGTAVQVRTDACGSSTAPLLMTDLR